MNYLISLIMVLTFSINSHAKKLYYPIEVVSGMADLIVVGKIENMGSGSYQFRISHTVKGQSKELIKVQMFREWTCDIRMKKAENGQELFLFLIKKAGKYEIINGSTGEMFIENGVILRTINNSKPTTEELVLALRIFTGSYEFKDKEYRPFDENIFVQLKTNKEIKEISKNDLLTSWFFDRVKEYGIEKQTN